MITPEIFDSNMDIHLDTLNSIAASQDSPEDSCSALLAAVAATNDTLQTPLIAAMRSNLLALRRGCSCMRQPLVATESWTNFKSGSRRPSLCWFRLRGIS